MECSPSCHIAPEDYIVSWLLATQGALGRAVSPSASLPSPPSTSTDFEKYSYLSKNWEFLLLHHEHVSLRAFGVNKGGVVSMWRAWKSPLTLISEKPNKLKINNASEQLIRQVRRPQANWKLERRAHQMSTYLLVTYMPRNKKMEEDFWKDKVCSCQEEKTATQHAKEDPTQNILPHQFPFKRILLPYIYIRLGKGRNLIYCTKKWASF